MRKHLLAALLMVVSLFPAYAQTTKQNNKDTSVVGTHSVEFLPGQSAGVLHTSSLVYKAIHPDSAYQNGGLTMIVGSIALSDRNGNTYITLKIGTKDVEVENSAFVKPAFAYLQTKTVSTVKSKHMVMNGDDGFLLVAIDLDKNALKLLEEMSETKKVSIGFNRREGGLDVVVPIDLTVAESEYKTSPTEIKVIRKRSNKALLNFYETAVKIMKENFDKFKH